MKKGMLGFLSSLILLVGITGSASAFGLKNWWFDIDGAGGEDRVLISEFFDVISPNLVDTDYVGAPVYDFTNYGVAAFTKYDGFSEFPGDSDGYELTAIYTFTGTANLTTGQNNFTGGSFDIYFDDGTGVPFGQAGDATTYLGANDGKKIASFDVVSGDGLVFPTGLPNGQFSITYEANYLAADHFFFPDGTDISTVDPITLTMGFSTTNASYLVNPAPIVIAEITDYANFAGTPVNTPPRDFWLSANGQFRIDVVPEPTTMMLFGVGLLGIAGISRRRVS